MSWERKGEETLNNYASVSFSLYWSKIKMKNKIFNMKIKDIFRAPN